MFLIFDEIISHHYEIIVIYFTKVIAEDVKGK